MPANNTASGNLFAQIPAAIREELIETVLVSDSVRIERIISHGQSSPAGFWYEQEEHEWVVLIRGAAKLRFEDRVVDMRPGDFINIPAHEKHRVELTTPVEPTIWLAVHYHE